ncbi:unnamed protein product [Natator depressus]
MEREEVQWCTGPSPGMAEWGPVGQPTGRRRGLLASSAFWQGQWGSSPLSLNQAAGDRRRSLICLNEAGDAVSWQASGWAARILQHEVDHLQGILYIDKMESRTFVNTRWMELNA